MKPRLGAAGHVLGPPSRPSLRARVLVQLSLVLLGYRPEQRAFHSLGYIWKLGVRVPPTVKAAINGDACARRPGGVVNGTGAALCLCRTRPPVRLQGGSSDKGSFPAFSTSVWTVTFGQYQAQKGCFGADRCGRLTG